MHCCACNTCKPEYLRHFVALHALAAGTGDIMALLCLQ